MESCIFFNPQPNNFFYLMLGDPKMYYLFVVLNETILIYNCLQNVDNISSPADVDLLSLDKFLQEKYALTRNDGTPSVQNKPTLSSNDHNCYRVSLYNRTNSQEDNNMYPTVGHFIYNLLLFIKRGYLNFVVITPKEQFLSCT